jgi:large repetitive protein
VAHDTLFVMLDTVKDNYGAWQIPWFNAVVNAHPETFIVVSMHYSAYGAIHTTTADELQAVWGPVFDEAKVDIVLSGHDHVYARTPAMYGDAPTTPENGTVYLSGGSASNKIYLVDSSVQAQYSYFYPEAKNLVTVVTIEDHLMSFVAMDDQGQIVDTFTLSPKVR